MYSLLGLVTGGMLVALIMPYRAERVRGVLVGFAANSLVFGVNPSAPKPVSAFCLVLTLTLLTASLFAPRVAERSGQTSISGLRSPVLFVAILFGSLTMVTVARQSSPLSGVGIIAAIGTLTALGVRDFARDDFRAFWRVMAGMSVIQLVLAVLEVTVWGRPIWGFGVTQDGAVIRLANPFFGDAFLRAEGTTAHPIALTLILTLVLVRLLEDRALVRPSVRFLLAAALGGGILLAGTRMVLVAVAAIGVFLVVGRSRSMGTRLALVVIALGSIAASATWLQTLRQELVTSGSYTHRLGALGSLPRLARRSPSEVLFGSGFGSEERLFSAGVLQQDGFKIVDNQLVTSFAVGGVLGVLLIACLFWRAWRHGNVDARLLIVVVAVFMFSFDLLRWFPYVLLVVVVLSTPSRWASGPAPQPGEVSPLPTVAQEQPT